MGRQWKSNNFDVVTPPRRTVVWAGSPDLQVPNLIKRLGTIGVATASLLNNSRTPLADKPELFARSFTMSTTETVNPPPMATLTAPPAITAENVVQLFPGVSTALIGGAHNSAQRDGDMEGYDEEQIKLMDEVCIVLDENDIPIGSASKKVCMLRLPLPTTPLQSRSASVRLCALTNAFPGHLMDNIDRGLLHRAFSVFLFDSQNRLLLQQRATEKITFPDMWTNTCCSHPLGIPGETGVGLEESIQGVRRAAVRKLDQELGIQAQQVPLDDFKFLTRIHYKSPSDGKWGEHEGELSPLTVSCSPLHTYSCLRGKHILTALVLVDYILFIKADVDVKVNPNEVRDHRYVSQEDLKAMFQDKSLKFTPWFKLICESMLFEWWDHLDSGLEKYMGEQEIRRML